jgi:hypothetical protein
LPRDKTKGCRERRGKPFCRQIGIKEQYGNIVEPKPSQVSPNHPNRSDPEVVCNHELTLILNHLALSISSPEKAGVGGSIPSLATIKLVTYRPPDSRFHSISFQNKMVPPSFASGWIRASGVSVRALKTSLRGKENVKVAIYVRVSTADQNQELQLRELQEYATRHQWEIALCPLLQETASNPRRRLKVTLSAGTNGRRQGAVYRPAGLGAGCRIIAIRAPSRYSNGGMTPRTPEG